METKLYIIGDPADKDNILAICSQLSEKGIQADAIFPAEDRAASENACTASVALLWISSKAGSQLFNIAQERNKRNLTTLNLFAEPIALYDSERRAVGRNKTLFVDVDPDGLIASLVDIIKEESPKDNDILKKNTDLSSIVAPVSNNLKSNITYADTAKTVSPQSALTNDTSSLVENESSHTNVQDEEESKIKESSPKSAIIKMIANVVGTFAFVKVVNLSLFSGIVFIIPIILNIKLMKKLNNWRKLNGWNTMVVVAFIVGLLTLVFSCIFAVGYFYYSLFYSLW